MGYLNYNNVTEQTGENFSITKEGAHVRFTRTVDGEYGGSYIDNNYISHLTKSIVGKEIDSILIIGLGVGVIPDWCARAKSAEIIDVLEIDSELITAIQNMGYLESSINIIQGDVYNYTPERNYDVILFDHWFFPDKNYETQKNTLTAHYSNYRTTNGVLYYALNDEIIS